MTLLTWDKVGERLFEAGVDRGVLYLHDGTAVAWNGLISVEESVETEITSFYLDGVKYLQTLAPKDFSAKLKAFTYPDEFDSVNGIIETFPGLLYHDQPSKSFDLSYRTGIGNDLAGLEYGYKIHLLYNLMAVPDTQGFSTQTDSGVQPVEFGWTLTGTPQTPKSVRPTVHISLDSTKVSPDILEEMEKILYGTAVSAPSIPSIQDVAVLFGYLGALIIVDHGDGTWSAIDSSNSYITMFDLTTFSIDNADVTYLDASTYTISSTNVNN